ncbi:protein AMBP [Gastrophryne carolinensis]
MWSINPLIPSSPVECWEQGVRKAAKKLGMRRQRYWSARIRQEGCQQMEMVMTTIEPGHYNYKSMHGDNEMVVGNTDYTIFAMEFTKTDHNGKSCVTLKLYGRSHDVPQEVLQQFENHIGDMGMSKEKDLIVFNGEQRHFNLECISMNRHKKLTFKRSHNAHSIHNILSDLTSFGLSVGRIIAKYDRLNTGQWNSGQLDCREKRVTMKTYLLLLPALLSLAAAVPVQPEVFIPTQENFDVSKIYGKWYDIAIGSTCSWLKQYKGKYDMGTLELSEGQTEGDIQILSTRMRHGTCIQVAGTYEKTDVAGKFNYYNQKFKAQIQNYIVYTNYDEYAAMLMRKTKGGLTTTTVKLYGRTQELRPSLIEDFKQFAVEQGIAEDSIFVLQNKGECTPGDIEVTPRRSARSAEVAKEEEEGSGDDSPFLQNKAASCHLPPAIGPCYGSHARYFYNASSMACDSFTYSGCLGNGNNYRTERECLQTCRTEAACRLPIVTGPCRKSEPRWAFDATQGKCVTFIYGGCQGNGNHFYTEKECKEYCGVPTLDEEEFL